jgi:hypothetical protein
MKNVAARVACLQGAWVYLVNGKELQSNSPVPTGFLREHSEQYRIWQVQVTAVMNRASFVDLGAHERQTIKMW